MNRFVLVPLMLLALAACAARPMVRAESACQLARFAEVPIETHGNMIFVHATIDHEPVTLLVDTGAERTLLTKSTVDRLKLPRDYQHATRTFGIGVPTVDWNAELPKGLELGGTRFPIDDVTVGKFGITDIAGESADGLLGADVLLAFDLDLDLPADRIVFYRPRPDCPDALPPWHQPYVAIKGVAVRTDRLMVPFELDGAAGMGVLDTGAQISSISRQMAARAGLADVDMASDRMVMAHGAAPDQVEVHIHRFREFRVGSTEVRSPVLPVVPMGNEMGDALIGGDFWQDRRVWLSLSTRRVFVMPSAHGAWIAVAAAGD